MHSQRIPVHSCSPCPAIFKFGNCWSLTHAADYARLYLMFTGVEFVQNHETELDFARMGPALVEIFEKIWDYLASLWLREEGHPKNCCLWFVPRNVLAIASDYACWIGPNTQNRTRNGSMVTEKTAEHCNLAYAMCQRASLISFKPHFVFPDRFDTHKHLQKPKTFRSANQRRQF